MDTTKKNFHAAGSLHGDIQEGPIEVHNKKLYPMYGKQLAGK